MLAVERRSRIISLINEKKSVYVPQLSKQFSVSDETIRRDLKKLEKQGILVRTYGGALLAEDSNVEMPVQIRQEINIEGKDAIGREAADMVRDGETIALDASTSALYVARHLKKRKALTVITNAEKIVLEFADCEDITVISTGGILRHKSLSYTGRAAESALSTYYADKVFFSCKGMTLNRGITDFNEQETDIRRAMLKCSETAVLLCDHTKFGRVGFVNIADFEDINCIITDKSMPDGWQKEIEGKGVNVLIAGEKSGRHAMEYQDLGKNHINKFGEGNRNGQGTGF